MLQPPVWPRRDVDPQELIREIEEDPLAQFVWSLPYAVPKALRKLSGAVRPFLTIPRRLRTLLEVTTAARRTGKNWEYDGSRPKEC